MRMNDHGAIGTFTFILIFIILMGLVVTYVGWSVDDEGERVRPVDDLAESYTGIAKELASDEDELINDFMFIPLIENPNWHPISDFIDWVAGSIGFLVTGVGTIFGMMFLNYEEMSYLGIIGLIIQTAIIGFFILLGFSFIRGVSV